MLFLPFAQKLPLTLALPQPDAGFAVDFDMNGCMDRPTS
jgi:hypothetical protein